MTAEQRVAHHQALAVVLRPRIGDMQAEAVGDLGRLVVAQSRRGARSTWPHEPHDLLQTDQIRSERAARHGSSRAVQPRGPTCSRC